MIYDKAKWHLNEAFPKGLPTFQSNVHSGFFLAWAINNDLVSDTFLEDYKDEIAEFKAQRMTGPQLFEISDGVLSSDELNEMGNRFAFDYYDPGTYFEDYDAFLGSKYTCLFSVTDSSTNFAIVARFLDQRYKAWTTSQSSASSVPNSASNDGR